ncbi:allene oxide cyclase barrel-like domain-containing protein [Streptomyces sp. DSM 118878]
MLMRCAALSLATAAVGVFAVGSAGADTAQADTAQSDTAQADTAKKGRVEVIELQIKDLEYKAVDLGEAGPSLGDMSVYCGTAVENGRKVGVGAGTSQIVYLDGDGGKATSQAVITLKLERGSLTMQSLLTDRESPHDMAITGGTGAYKDARGSVRYWDIATPQERMRAEILH